MNKAQEWAKFQRSLKLGLGGEQEGKAYLETVTKLHDIELVDFKDDPTLQYKDVDIKGTNVFGNQQHISVKNNLSGRDLVIELYSGRGLGWIFKEESDLIMYIFNYRLPYIITTYELGEIFARNLHKMRWLYSKQHHSICIYVSPEEMDGYRRELWKELRKKEPQPNVIPTFPPTNPLYEAFMATDLKQYLQDNLQDLITYLKSQEHYKEQRERILQYQWAS